MGSIGTFFSREYVINKAVKDISFTIDTGNIVALLGPNGAGKSTLIKIMIGVLQPSSGTVRINGVDPSLHRNDFLKSIGVVFGQRTQLWWALPVIESFRQLKEIYEVPDKTYNHNIQLFTDVLDIGNLLSKPVRELSLGQRTLCDILAAFLHDPILVFLDEPTIGLDVSMKNKIRKLIKELNKEKTTCTILTSHDMGDVDALCERLLLIDKGSLIYNDSLKKFQTYFGRYKTLRIQIAPMEEQNYPTKKDILRELATHQISTDHVEKVSVLEPSMYELLVNEEKADTLYLIQLIKDHYMVNDIQITNLSTADVLNRIYEGNL